jgi:hypothetical protein
MVCIAQILFVVVNMDQNVCYKQDSDFLSPELWLILLAFTEITLLTVNFACDCCCSNTIITGTAWGLSITYVILIFIGVNISWYQCFLGDHIIGPTFVASSLVAGLIISIVNVNLIDLLYHYRVKSGLHGTVPVYDALRV